MPTIVGILTFMSRINFSLTRAEHETSFITWRPDVSLSNEDTFTHHIAGGGPQSCAPPTHQNCPFSDKGAVEVAFVVFGIRMLYI